MEKLAGEVDVLERTEVANGRAGAAIHSAPGISTDPLIATTSQGIRAVKLSLIVMLSTALMQGIVVYFTHSVALLADTIHNFGDALTAIPLWIAFSLVRRQPSARFSYGYGRVEDLAGVFIVLTIFLSACVAGYEAVLRFIHPQQISHLPTLLVATLVGYLGNEAVARIRIAAGKAIHSEALITDGKHARVDSWTSLAVFVGAIGVWLGQPLADPIVGLLICLAILKIVWDTGREVFSRLIDGVDPQVLTDIRSVVGDVPGVLDISEVRARWLGHRLHAEINITVDGSCMVREGHDVAKAVHTALKQRLKYLASATIHVDPQGETGERYHQ